MQIFQVLGVAGKHAIVDVEGEGLLHNQVGIVVNQTFFLQKGLDQGRWQNHTTDPQGWKEGSGKGFEVDDPVFRVQIMKGDSPAAIKISQIVILNNIDLIGLSQADNLLFFLQSIGSPQGIVEAGNSIEEGNLTGLENPLQLG